MADDTIELRYRMEVGDEFWYEVQIETEHTVS